MNLAASDSDSRPLLTTISSPFRAIRVRRLTVGNGGFTYYSGLIMPTSISFPSILTTRQRTGFSMLIWLEMTSVLLYRRDRGIVPPPSLLKDTIDDEMQLTEIREYVLSMLEKVRSRPLLSYSQPLLRAFLFLHRALVFHCPTAVHDHG